MADRSITLETKFTADLSEFTNALEKIGTDFSGLVTQIAKARADLSKFEQSMKGASAATDKLSASLIKVAEKSSYTGKQISKVEGGLNRIIAAMKVTASYGLAATAIFAVTNAFRTGISAIVDYDQSLKNLQAITGATDEQMLAMDETIRNVARNTKFSATEVADGMRLIGQAGFDAAEAMQVINSVAMLATGTMEDFTKVSDLVTTTLRAFNLEAFEAGRVSDVMANAVNKSKLTIDKLRTSFNYVGAAASQAGLTLEETAATMMTLANNGLRASTIGTGLRQVLAKLISPNEKVREAFEAQGIAIEKASLASNDYQTVLKYLTRVLVDSEKGTVNMAKAFELFGLRGAQAAAVIVKGFLSGQFEDALSKTYDVGTAAEMAAIQAEGLGLKFKNLADRALLVVQAIGDSGATGALSVFADTLKAVATALEGFFSSDFGQVTVSMVAWTAAISGAVKAAQLLSTALKSLIATNIAGYFSGLAIQFNVLRGYGVGLASSLTQVAGTMKMLPFLAIVTAISGVIVALERWSTANERQLKLAQKEVEQLKQQTISLQGYLGALVKLKEKVDAGTGSQREYDAMVKRLVNDHKELAAMVDLTKASHTDLIGAVEELNRVLEEKQIQKQIEVWLSFEKMLARVKAEIDAVNERVADPGMGDYTAHIYEAKNAAEDLSKEMLRLSGVTAETNVAMIAVLQKWAEWVIQGQKTEDEIIDIINEMLRLGTITLQQATKMVIGFESVLKKAKEVKDEIKSLSGELKDAGGTISDVFTQMFEGASAAQQVELTKMHTQMTKELAAYKKWAEDHKDLTDEMAAQMTAIQIKHYEKMADLLTKDVDDFSAKHRLKLAVYQQFARDLEAEYEKMYMQIKIQETRAIVDAQGDTEKIAKAKADAIAKLLKLEEDYGQQIKALKQANNKELIEFDKEYQEEKEKLEKAYLSERKKQIQDELAAEKDKYQELKELTKERISQIKEEYKTLKEEHKATLTEIKEQEKAYQADSKAMAGQGFSSRIDYYSAESKAWSLMNEARLKNDKDLAKQAYEIYKSLGQEVTDINGDVIITQEEAARTAMSGMKNANELIMDILKTSAAETEQSMNEKTNAIKSLGEQLKEEAQRVEELDDKLRNMKIEIDLAGLDKAKSELDKFIEESSNRKVKVEVEMQYGDETFKPTDAEKGAQPIKVEAEYDGKKFEADAKESATKVGGELEGPYVADVQFKSHVEDTPDGPVYVYEQVKTKIESDPVQVKADAEPAKKEVQSISEVIDGLSDKSVKVDVQADSTQVDSIKTKLETVKDIAESGIRFVMEGIDAAASQAASLLSSLTQLTGTEWIVKMATEGLAEALQMATELSMRLEDAVKFSQEFGEVGMAFGSQEEGYQHGGYVPKTSIVHAKEFVQREASVDKYGLPFMNALNRLAIPADTIKSLFSKGVSAGTTYVKNVTQSAGPAIAGTLHTLNLNVNGESHTVYAKPDTVNDLATSLRRARLLKV